MQCPPAQPGWHRSTARKPFLQPSIRTIQSGLAAFVIERDGQRIATLPEKSANPFGRPLFQGLQYSDTPVQPLAAMTFTDAQATADAPHTYRVIAVNTVGLESGLESR